MGMNVEEFREFCDLNVNLNRIADAITDTNGSSKMGDFLDAMTKMANTITEYYQMKIDAINDSKWEL